LHWPSVLSSVAGYPSLHIQWSFGVTCWEVFSAGEIPYPSLHPRQVLNMLEEGERMERPRNAACSEDT